MEPTARLINFLIMGHTIIFKEMIEEASNFAEEKFRESAYAAGIVVLSKEYEGNVLGICYFSSYFCKEELNFTGILCSIRNTRVPPLGIHLNLTEDLHAICHSLFYFCFYSKGSDYKPVGIRSLINIFTSDNCPSLAGKPKLFLIQATEMGKTS